MATSNFLIFFFFFHCICIPEKWGVGGFEQSAPSSSAKGAKRPNFGMKMEGFSTTTVITNPANFPAYTPTPTVVTVPSSNPIPNPVTTVPTTPLTDPTTVSPVQAGGTGTGSWCIARTGATESSLQTALDYACGIGGADCSMIQDGASCYNPNSLDNHASYAFNSYFQKNPVSTSCDFGGVALIVNTNPSSGTCVYPSSSNTMTAQPAMTTGGGGAVPSSTFPPAAPTDFPPSTIPTGTSSSPETIGTPYGFPGFGGYDSPPSSPPGIFGIDSPSIPSSNIMPAGSVVAAGLRPIIGFTILLVFFSTAKQILGN